MKYCKRNHILDGNRTKENRCRLCKNKETYKRKLKRDYNISVADYDFMYRFQNGCCAVCNKEDGLGRYQRICVDHDHKTGLVRGLLCRRCNRVLGMMQDNALLLYKLSMYLTGAPLN